VLIQAEVVAKIEFIKLKKKCLREIFWGIILLFLNSHHEYYKYYSSWFLFEEKNADPFLLTYFALKITFLFHNILQHGYYEMRG